MMQGTVQGRIAEITTQPVRIANGNVGKPYESKLDFEKLGWKDILEYQFEGLQETGLTFDDSQKQITGIPTISGDIEITFNYKIQGQAQEEPFNKKVITLIVNPNPKSLWKNIESDRNAPFWKEDNITLLSPIGDNHILISSKRGRSHANVGSCREDDFAFKDFENGWSIVSIADGAGSAKLSRIGSQLSCNSIVEYFTEESSIQGMADFESLLNIYNADPNEDTQKKLNLYVYNFLGKGVFNVYKILEKFAAEQKVTLKDLSSTLIFCLFKKFETGYAFLSFGVGDCPMAVLNKDVSEVTLLNWIDVGEFGGGTRFITMPDIFQNEKFATRFGFRQIEDFSYIILMSDGIYDPKFVVEANLPKIEKWQQFLEDLNGNNEEQLKVGLNADNKDIAEQFSTWMDFWSPGNHDDRTLAIIF